MLDCALLGFEEHGKPIFPCLYAVVESSTWKNGKKVGIYNRIPIHAQPLVGNEQADFRARRRARTIAPFHTRLSGRN